MKRLVAKQLMLVQYKCLIDLLLFYLLVVSLVLWMPHAALLEAKWGKGEHLMI
jgi:hypothetical protein